MKKWKICFALATAPLFVTQGAAQPACAALDAALPTDMVGWNTAPEPLAPGKPAIVVLAAANGITFAAPPGRTPDPAKNAGVFSFSVNKPGTYRIALGVAAWIDIVRNGRVIASTTHAHGPACSTIRKIVSFPLVTGRYQVQLSGAKETTARILIAGPS